MTDTIAARHDVFLRQHIAHSIGITRDPRNISGVHADAAVNAWWANRLLAALADAIPNDLPALLADISEELEMGYAYEVACEQAAAAGIDVEALAEHMEQAFTKAATACPCGAVPVHQRGCPGASQ